MERTDPSEWRDNGLSASNQCRVPTGDIQAAVGYRCEGEVAEACGGITVKLPRRHFLHLVLGTAALSTISSIAGAQGYPTRPVRWVVGFPPGGPNDITARIMAEFLSERLHQQFAVENRPGAASNIATESVARSQPDGYTVIELATVNAINASTGMSIN
jgi:Tripartite tricarboxylate transporter family receptor